MRQTFKELFKAFTKAKDHILWKEDIRVDILYDEEAKDGTIRQLIYEARGWLREHKPEYWIETINRIGYRFRRSRKGTVRHHLGKKK